MYTLSTYETLKWPLISVVDESNSLCPWLCIVGTNIFSSERARVNECVRICLRTHVSDNHLSMIIYLKTIWVITLKWVPIKIITFFPSSALLLPFNNAVHNFSAQKEEVNLLLVWSFGSSAMVSRFNFIQRHFTKLSTYPLHLKWCLELYMIKLETRSGWEL